MEHQKAAGKSMNKILNFLPRATSSVTFQNHTLYSPAKDKKSSEKTHKSHLGIGLSGPMLSMVPSENHRKIKNDAVVYEPTSPRVSCMGQVKCKHYRKLTGAGNVNTDRPTNKFSRSTTSYTVARTYKNEEEKEKIKKVDTVVEKNKKKSGLRRLFTGGAGANRRKSDATDASKTELSVPKGPCLSTMKRFSSGRETFMNFDWVTQVAPLDSAHRDYFTDDEKDGGDREEVVMPSSVPVMVRNKGVCDDFNRVIGINVEQRKEINLWKRRTMAQPKPLQVHGAN